MVKQPDPYSYNFYKSFFLPPGKEFSDYVPPKYGDDTRKGTIEQDE